MKIAIIPDSFKGSLSSQEVCDCIKEGLLKVSNNEIIAVPMSDGGEGFAECFSAACNGNYLYTKCADIFGNIINASVFTYGDTAIIECATASGLQKKKDIMSASSKGTGELIKFAIEKGYKNIILGLGGSGCCDGGIGAITALKGLFFDQNKNIINNPTPQNIQNIFYCDLSNAYEFVKDVHFTFACDVTNCYYGQNGAAYVFAKQKGATDEMLPILDDNLKHIEKLLNKNINNISGAGAAGGMCGGLFALTGGKIESGFDILSNFCNLESIIATSDLIVTGEGKTDLQTLMGKLPQKICILAKKHRKKCVVISGKIEGVSLGDKMISLVDENICDKEAISNAKSILKEKAKKIID